MPWNRKDNPWVKKQKRQCLLASIGLVLMMCLGFAFIGLVLSAPIGKPFIPSLLALGMCVAVVSVFWQCSREWRVLNLVPAHDAMVCSKCLREMESESEHEVRCPAGHGVWPREELVKYWEQFGLARMASWRTLRAKRRQYEHKRVDIGGRYQEWIQQHAVLVIVVVPPVLTAVILTLYGVFISASPTDLLRFGFFLYFLGTGGVCLSLGMKQRRGDEEYCGACQYQRAAVDGHSADRCPECGAAWNAPGVIVRGTESSKPGYTVAGVLLFVLGVVLGPSSPLGVIPRFFAGAMPTSVLVSSLGASAQADAESWVELGNRTLTAGERNRLAKLLLDQRLDVSYFSATDGAAWLEQEVSAGTLSQDLIDRFFNESLSMWFDGPSQAKVGQDVTLTIEGAWRTGSRSLWDIHVAVAGFHVDDEPHHYGGKDKWRPALDFDSQFREVVRNDPKVKPAANEQYAAPHHLLNWDQSGRHTIHFTAWIVVCPAGSGLTGTTGIVWLPDGSPSLAASAVRVIPVNLTHAVEVKP